MSLGTWMKFYNLDLKGDFYGDFEVEHQICVPFMLALEMAQLHDF